MVDYRQEIAEIILPATAGFSADEIKGMVEAPADRNMGDYAFPCFKLAKTMRKAPNAIAKEIAEKIAPGDIIAKVENVNAYVNIFLNRGHFMKNVVGEVLSQRERYGRSDMGKGKRVIVEYSAPNIAKPFHIGHIRSTVIGHSIYKIYDFMGYETVRINHLGDYGTQFGKMICAYRRWGNREDVENEPIKTLLSYYIKFHEESEQDPTLEDEARAVFTRLEQGDPEEVELWQWFRDESLKEFGRVYKMLGIEFDSYAGESFYSDKMGRMLDILKDKGLLVASEGAQIVELSDYGMPPALITKQDGSTLYITRDIAAAVYRKEHYDFYKNLYIVASQQNLHFQQWIKIIELMGYGWAKDCVHIPFGLVSLEDGTMSTRQGRVVFLEEVLTKAVEKTKEIIVEKGVNTDNIDETAKQVGIGAVVFNELANSRIKDYVFSWGKVLNFDGETGPYVQYSHARLASVMRNAGGAEAEQSLAIDSAGAGHITGDSAFELAKLIYKFPAAVADAAEKYEPSIVTRHIVDTAQAVNRFYHDEHVLVDDEAERSAKLALVYSAKTVLKNGLGLLCMDAPEKM
ncbi:MAG: arginine--tRNA ligase [Clostridiales bacterium]|nr:arginine--tRNA ligase [Clostridiales bacterium]